MNAQNPTPHPVAIEVRTRDRSSPRKPTHANSRAKEGRGWVAFNYQLPKPSPQGQIVVRDFTGRPVAQLPMNAQQGQQVLDTRGLAAGTYLVEYRDAAMTLHADKLVIEP